MGPQIFNVWTQFANTEDGKLTVDGAGSVHAAPIGLTYPAVDANPAHLVTRSYQASVEAGAAELALLMATLPIHCPTSRFVLAGFSQGADVITNALPTLNYPGRVTAIVLLASPHYSPRDTAVAYKGGANLGALSSTNVGSLGQVKVSGIAPWMAGKVLAVCKWFDFVCTGTGPDQLHPFAHQDYSDLYASMGQWAANKTVVPKPAPIGLGRVTDVTGTAGDSSIALTWTAPTRGIPTSYQIRRSSDRGVTWTTTTTPTAATAFAFTGLTNGKSYIFNVRAKNATGVGLWSYVSDPIAPTVGPTIEPGLTNAIQNAEAEAPDLNGVLAGLPGEAGASDAFTFTLYRNNQKVGTALFLSGGLSLDLLDRSPDDRAACEGRSWTGDLSVPIFPCRDATPHLGGCPTELLNAADAAMPPGYVRIAPCTTYSEGRFAEFGVSSAGLTTGWFWRNLSGTWAPASVLP